MFQQFWKNVIKTFGHPETIRLRSEMATKDDFGEDRQGKRFQDIASMRGFEAVFRFFDDHERRERMWDSEFWHERPAFAGVVKEFENDLEIADFYLRLTPKQAIRFRQAVGVVIKVVMRRAGMGPTGKRGSLAALSDWFKRSERYGLVFEDLTKI